MSIESIIAEVDAPHACPQAIELLLLGELEERTRQALQALTHTAAAWQTLECTLQLAQQACAPYQPFAPALLEAKAVRETISVCQRLMEQEQAMSESLRARLEGRLS